MDQLVPLFLSFFSVLISIALIISTIFFKPRIAKEWILLVWAAVFLGVGFGLIEYAVWVDGANLFEIVFSPSFPLLAFFGAWFGFLIWLFEKHGKRKVWMILLAILVVLVVVAVNCMDCVKF
ncbi:MAG: hypothetical protein ABIH90_03090 [Candidatus Aenigmatarchaeota archaeon]